MIVIIPMLANADSHTGQFTVGFIKLPATDNAPPMGIWYPSTDAETPGKLGPFETRYAFNGDPASGLFPLIILSHGHTGRYRNHRQTAAALTRNGYIVIAPDHLSDGNMNSKETIISTTTIRVAEINMATKSTCRAKHPYHPC